jgi:hypothetical protein
MGFLDPPSPTKYPRTWRDQSFEFKCMFAYHIVMMAMFATGFVPVAYEVAIAAGLLVLFAAISLDRRRRLGWQRPPLQPLDLLKTAGTLAALGLFGYVASRNVPIGDPHFAPWFLGLAGIGVFGVLERLKLVAFSEAEFLRLGQSHTAPEVVVPPAGPSWHRAVRGVFTVCFFAAWLSAMGAFYFHGVAQHEGSRIPTASQPVALTDHGDTVYISKDRAALVDGLQLAMMIGIPAVILAGFILHFVLRVPLFSNFPGRRWPPDAA